MIDSRLRVTSAIALDVARGRETASSGRKMKLPRQIFYVLTKLGRTFSGILQWTLLEHSCKTRERHLQVGDDVCVLSRFLSGGKQCPLRYCANKRSMAIPRP